jgi:hypothetical protein
MKKLKIFIKAGVFVVLPLSISLLWLPGQPGSVSVRPDHARPVTVHREIPGYNSPEPLSVKDFDNMLASKNIVVCIF